MPSTLEIKFPKVGNILDKLDPLSHIFIIIARKILIELVEHRWELFLDPLHVFLGERG